MERKQSNQNQQTSINNSNDSNSTDSFDSNSSAASNYDYLSFYRNNRESRRLTTPLWRPNSDYLLQNVAFRLNGLSINGAATTVNENNFLQNGRPIARTILVGENSRNNMEIGGNRRMFLSSPANGNNNIVRNRMANVEIEKEVMERCDFVSKCAMTINGCDDLRRMLGEEDRGMKETIIMKVTADLPILMVHEIGFRFAQAVFDCCNEQQMSRVLQSVVVGNHSAFLHICNNNYGKEAVKSLIQNLKTGDQVVSVTNVVTDYIGSFTNSYNAQQILDFFILVCNDDFTTRLVFNAMARNCLGIATNRLGCMMLQRYICPIYIESDFVSLLLNNIVLNSLILANDNYGNYVVQHVIASGVENVTRSIVKRLKGRFSDLAMTKCGSNVVEKCLQMAHQNEVVKILMELTNSIHLPSIAQHPFGNYVIQSALEQAHSRGMEDPYRNLVKHINVHASILQTHLYGRTVISKIRKLNTNRKHLVREIKFST